MKQDQAVIIKLSAPIKHIHAEKCNLDYEALMSSNEYKETHRKNMLEWSQKIRNEDYGYFCKAAVQMSKGRLYVPFYF